MAGIFKTPTTRPLIGRPSPKSVSGVFSSVGCLWMGSETQEVPLELFVLNRRRLVEKLSKNQKPKNKPVVLLKGGTELPLYDTDSTYDSFHQESFFMWTFGVIEPGCYGAIDVSTGLAYLFVPRITDRYQVISLGSHPVEEFTQKYNIRNVHYCDEMLEVLRSIHPSEVLTLKGVNSDSGLRTEEVKFQGMEEFEMNTTTLYNEMSELRVFKTELEIKVMKYVAEVSAEGHKRIMRFVQGGNKFEYQCEAEFFHQIYSSGGCRQAGCLICATGTNSAILDYGKTSIPNDKFILPNDMCLCDMGAKYFGYTTSITSSFPASGKFTPDQRLIYEAVLVTSTTVIKACKPGVSFVDLHILGLQTLFEELVKGGILQGEPGNMVTVGLGPIFQPHGLGHFIGLDVRDVGGYLPGTPPRRGEPPGIERLKTARVLEENMVLVIQPGCYFIDVLLDEAIADPVLRKFLVKDAVQSFRGFGGVRIGDTVVITKEGCEILSILPRTCKDIEKWIAGKDDKKFHKSR